MPQLRTAYRLAACSAAALLLTLGAACSKDDDSSDATSATTQVEGSTSATSPDAGTATPGDSSTAVPDSTDDTGTTDSSEDPKPTTTLPTASAADITTAVYWVRPAGGEPRTIPGYSDPEGRPTPLLVYGSVSNNGAGPLASPRAAAVWRNAAGEVQVTTVASLHAADGSYITTIEPGQTVDVFTLINGEPGSVFDLLVPEFVVSGP